MCVPQDVIAQRRRASFAESSPLTFNTQGDPCFGGFSLPLRNKEENEDQGRAARVAHAPANLSCDGLVEVRKYKGGLAQGLGPKDANQVKKCPFRGNSALPQWLRGVEEVFPISLKKALIAPEKALSRPWKGPIFKEGCLSSFPWKFQV